MRESIVVAAGIALLLLPASAAAQTPSATPLLEGQTTTLTPTGAEQPVHISVQSWRMANRGGVIRQIPLQGFYVAYLIDGTIATTIDGLTTKRDAGSFWTVKAGASMEVKVLSEFAVLETTVVAKP